MVKKSGTKKRKVVKKGSNKKAAKKSKPVIEKKTKLKNGFRIDFKRPVQLTFRFPKTK